MPGNKNKKDPLEEFFQKKAEEYDIGYREEDWLRLEKKLDLRDAQITYQRKVRWKAAAAVLAISMLGYFTFDNYVRLNEINQFLSDDFTMPEEPAPGMADDSIEPAERGDDSIESGERAEDAIEPATPTIEHSAGYAESEMAGRLMPVLDDSDEVIVASQLELRMIPVYSMKSTMPKRAGYPDVRTPDEMTDQTFLSELQPEPEHDDAIIPDRSRFSIGLAMAPDLSTVSSFSGFYNPGYKAGVTVEYRLTSRLSVSTGLVPSLVRYSAENREYTPAGYYGGLDGPVSMVGECLLFDIPVSLAYELFTFGKSAMFISTGLSSYIMLNEEYSFSFESDSGGGTDSWSDQTGTRHWFSNAGFSIGYERAVTPNISLRAEPYVRIPIRNVGWANVRLYSMGSFFSIQYRL